MEKLTKTFQSGEVLKAQDLNNVKDKVNELVDNANTNTGGSGGGGSITVDSSLSLTSANPVQNKVVTEELNKKVEKVDGKGLSSNDYTTADKEKLTGLSNYDDTAINKAISDERNRAIAAESILITGKVDKESGKGLSTNDYTTADKQKLSGLPGQVYSKEEVDSRILGPISVSISSDEKKIGSFMVGSESHDLYERTFILSGLPKTVGATTEFILSDEALGFGIYLSIEGFSVSAGKTLKAEFFNEIYEVQKIYVNDNLSTVAVLKCKEATALDLTATLRLMYCKFSGEIVTFEVDLPAGTNAENVNLVFPALKYDKKIAFSYINDDSYTIWNHIFCRVNKKWMSDEIGVDPWKHEPGYKFFFHYGMPEGAYESTGSVPDKFLEYSDGCGVKHRFASSVSTWVDKLYDPKDPSDINMLYGPAMPYNSALESRIMFDFGFTVNWHDVFNSDDVRDQATFDKRISEKGIEFKRLINVVPKVMVEPNGEHEHIALSQGNELFDMVIAQSGTGIDLVYPFKAGFTLDKNDITVKRVFTSGTDESYVTNMVNTLTQYRNATDKSTIAWMIGGAHRSTAEGAAMFTEIESRWGCSGDDSIWFPSVDEFFEYWFMTKFAMVGRKVEGQKVKFLLYMPSADNFWFKSISCLLSGITSTNGITVSTSCPGESHAMSGNKLLVNLDFNAGLIDKVERYVSKFEQSESTYDYEDAAYFIQHLKQSLQQPYLTRLAAVSNPVNITSLSVDETSLNLANSVPGTLRITALPADNSQMNKLTYTLRGIDNLNVSLSANNNVATVTIVNTNKVAGTYNGFIKFGVEGSNVVSEEIAIQVIVEAGAIDKPITSLQLECAGTIDINQPLSCTCTALPADNTNMQSIVIATTGNISNKKIAGNVLTFNVMWASAKTDTIVVSAGEITSSKSITINASTPPAGDDDNIACFVAYDYPGMGSKAYLEDSLYGTINHESGGYNSTTNNEPIYSKSGQLLSEWKRAGDEQESYVTNAGYTYQKWVGASAQSGDTSSVFATSPTFYQNVTKYNVTSANCLRYRVPNGSYKVRFLSSTTENNDTYSNAVITINGEDRTSEFPTEPYQQKQNWTDYMDVVVSDGRITIMLVVNPSKRVGFSAIEIKKIS